MSAPIVLLQKYLRSIPIHGLLVPKTDPHRCEFTLEHDNYLKFITGFTGSMGFAIILWESAAVFVDGRYTLQAQAEIDSRYFSCHDYTYKEICNWIKLHMQSKGTLAYDPLLFSEKDLDYLKPCCQEAGVELIEVEQNPIDVIWNNRPKELKPPLEVHLDIYSGETHHDKIIKISNIIKHSKAHGLFLNTPEDIAWLLNIRSSKRPYTPAASCYFYLSGNKNGFLFIDDEQVPDNVLRHLGQSITIRPYQAVFSYLREMAQGNLIIMDPSEVPLKATHVVNQGGGRILFKPNPCQLLKACKNSVEVQGAFNAHIRDGTALVNFMAWLYQVGIGHGVTELEALQKLFDFRKQQSLFIGNSFDPIMGSGPNGAIVHYRATEATNRTLHPQELLLLDSGGQYLDGTTDVTRTISLDGIPTWEQKNRFTRALKGHIAIASAIFPIETTGSQLDALARYFLWKIGCDYSHGTGHGVGSYLGVHEGPQSISSRPSAISLRPGMILSNEPGYYKPNEYGIRIESLVLVKPIKNPSYERKMHGFETLTLVPIDLSLIECNLLTTQEREWINHYHLRIKNTLIPHVLTESRPWLENSTRAI